MMMKDTIDRSMCCTSRSRTCNEGTNRTPTIMETPCNPGLSRRPESGGLTSWSRIQRRGSLVDASDSPDNKGTCAGSGGMGKGNCYNVRERPSKRLCSIWRKAINSNRRHWAQTHRDEGDSLVVLDELLAAIEDTVHAVRV